MSKQKKNSRRHSRIRFPFPALNIGNIIFGALFFYMAVSLFFYLTADHIKSFQVVQGTLSRNDTYTAFAMRTESVQLSSGSGYVQFYTPNASKISRGSAVYGISATENADTSGISADAATRTSLRSSLARFSSDYDSSSFSGIYQLKTELSAKLLADAAENGDSSSQTIFYADQDGVVVYGSDGYESYTEDSLTPELFSTKASVVSFDSGAQTEPGNAVYRLVTDEQWEIAVPVTNKQVVTLSNFSTIKVKFLKDGKTQTGTLNLKSINDQNYAVISFTSGMIRYAEDRFLSVELVTNTGSGLKIPNTAITEKDFYKIPAQMLVQGGDSNSSVSCGKRPIKKEKSCWMITDSR